MIIKYIFYAILFYILYRLIKGIFLAPAKQPGRRERAAGNAVIDEMVIDPVCRVYIPKREAITARVQGETIYFCSQECKEKYFQDAPENGSGTSA